MKISSFMRSNYNRFNKHNNDIKNRLIDKFNLNKFRQSPIPEILFNNDHSGWLVNISNKQIPKEVLSMLSLGGKFGLPISNTHKDDRLASTLEIVKNFEVKYHLLPTDLLNETRCAISNALQKFLDRRRHINHVDKHISNIFNYCKKFLRDNDDLMVTKADKGQTTVILNKPDYYSKMSLLLDDKTTYNRLNKYPTKRIMNKINDMVKVWRDEGIIDEIAYKYLHNTNGNLPRCYGLPKIHKPGYSLRIIVSTNDSPLYNIASYFSKILKKAVPKPNSFIQDSWSFANTIRNIAISPNELLVSFDVTSLFTNVSKELVINSIEKRWPMISSFTKLNLQQFLYAIDLILSSTSFVFNKQIYEQIFGTPMGSPLSSIVADMVLDDLESQCLTNLDFKIRVYYRYVDDIFMIISKDRLHDALNLSI
ncbi:hypothetical protein DMN91_011681 [Ooceraea biroi]|uniref:Reverse transcriptase domain-containing protein n=1 Tax=Ooceraea biroi TaxID=2015173 RepID=A0A3L8D6P0_OOCBI|nr:uncharacterized protein LOC113563039 [Ooceraea biroi]RLU15924.1 hypothetical protein DMN91_011681 [Ooceraea biroi]